MKLQPDAYFELEIKIEAEKVAYHVDVTPKSVQRVLQQHPKFVTEAVEDIKKKSRK